MGLAGSGKSTQGQMLAEKTGRIWLSTGQILRDTPDEKIHAILRSGNLVPDTYVIPLMSEAIQQILAQGKDAVIDGYPRTVAQAEWLAENVAEKIEAVVKIEVPKPELLQRMKLRGRADDRSIKAIEERFRLVEQSIYAVCDILSAQGVPIKTVDGMGAIETVQQRINQAITEVESE